MKIAVTGAGGVLGTTLARTLLADEQPFVRSGAATDRKYSAADLHRPDDAARAFDGVDIVIHAASPGAPNPPDESV